MALYFPLNVSSYFNPQGFQTGINLQNCLDEIDEKNSLPVRCVGPTPTSPVVYFEDGPSPSDPSKIIKGWVDPTGALQLTNKYTLPLVRQYKDDNTAFLRGFEKSWVKMATAGYGTVDGAGGKLGYLKSLVC